MHSLKDAMNESWKNKRSPWMMQVLPLVNKTAHFFPNEILPPGERNGGLNAVFCLFKLLAQL